MVSALSSSLSRSGFPLPSPDSSIFSMLSFCSDQTHLTFCTSCRSLGNGFPIFRYIFTLSAVISPVLSLNSSMTTASLSLLHRPGTDDSLLHPPRNSMPKNRHIPAYIRLFIVPPLPAVSRSRHGTTSGCHRLLPG